MLPMLTRTIGAASGAATTGCGAVSPAGARGASGARDTNVGVRLGEALPSGTADAGAGGSGTGGRERGTTLRCSGGAISVGAYEGAAAAAEASAAGSGDGDEVRGWAGAGAAAARTVGPAGGGTTDGGGDSAAGGAGSETAPRKGSGATIGPEGAVAGWEVACAETGAAGVCGSAATASNREAWRGNATGIAPFARRASRLNRSPMG
ncbi:hypothetical protein [Ancylobacter defluvii]|nr:hypothetical protein [Ancylobacter defluvii]MBS7588557.1 hypothetical protein [Ancylobacter defluvii]